MALRARKEIEVRFDRLFSPREMSALFVVREEMLRLQPEVVEEDPSTELYELRPSRFARSQELSNELS